MIVVGVRQLKEQLSQYLKRVRAGERVIVTDRKKKVAVLVPYETHAEEEKLFRLIQRGIAHWSGGAPKGMPSRVACRGKEVSEAVLENRR